MNVTGANYSIIRNNKSYLYSRDIMIQKGNGLQASSYILVQGNEFGNDGNTGPGVGDENVLEIHNVHNLLFELNNVYGAHFQGGVATKEDAPGNTNHIYRFNKFHDNGESGLYIGAYSYETGSLFYVYGNLFYDNGKAGFSAYRHCEDVYFWSNIVYDNGGHGFLTWNDSEGPINNINVFNNTFARNGDTFYPLTVSKGGIVLTYGTNISVKNNIFYNNRPSGGAGEFHQNYDSTSGTYDQNTYYHTGADLLPVNLAYYNGYKTLAQFNALANVEPEEVARSGLNRPKRG